MDFILFFPTALLVEERQTSGVECWGGVWRALPRGEKGSPFENGLLELVSGGEPRNMVSGLVCALTSSRRPPSPARPDTLSHPLRGADFESILAVSDQNWPKTVEDDLKRSRIGPNLVLRRGLVAGQSGWPVRALWLGSKVTRFGISSIHSEFHLGIN